jgi:hypothetical protein
MSATLAVVLFNVLPSYGYVAFGVGLKRFTRVTEKQLSAALLYVLIPLLVFRGTASAPLAEFFGFALLSYAISATITLVAAPLRRRYPSVMEGGLLQCAFAYFNNGWLGIPLGYAFFGDEGLRLMSALHVGGMLYGNTIGYGLMAQGQRTLSGTLRSLFKLPSLHAFALGTGAAALGLGEQLLEIDAVRLGMNVAAFATSIFGMALVGMGLARQRLTQAPWKELAALLSWRYVLALLVTGVTCAVLGYADVLTALQVKVLLLMAILPIASNTLVFANMTGRNTPVLGLALFTSTLASCLLLPPMAMLLGGGAAVA